MIDENTCEKIDAAGVKTIQVYSVITCGSKKGVCAMCYGREVDPCESRFVNRYRKKTRPRQCIDKMYKQSGCTKDGKICYFYER